MNGEQPNSDMNDNREFFPEKFMETKIKWINLCPVSQ